MCLCVCESVFVRSFVFCLFLFLFLHDSTARKRGTERDCTKVYYVYFFCRVVQNKFTTHILCRVDNAVSIMCPGWTRRTCPLLQMCSIVYGYCSQRHTGIHTATDKSKSGVFICIRIDSLPHIHYSGGGQRKTFPLDKTMGPKVSESLCTPE